MKTLSVAVVYLLLCTLIIGAIVIEPMVATSTIQVKVQYVPWRINLKHPPRWGFFAFVMPGRRAYDPKSIRLDGVLAPTFTICWAFLFISRFDPDAVVEIIWQKIYHMSIPPGNQWISLKITGLFRDGTPFEGTGKIFVKVPP